MTYDSTLPYPRDLVGYGRTPPHPHWPGQARIAVQFVLNYEEGGENAVLHGDAGSEQFLSEMFNPASYPERHMSMEGIYEYGEREGLGLIKGSIRYLDIEEKVPHMGWNDLKFEKDSDPVLRKIKEGEYVYFVHSYYADSDGSEIVAFAEYGTKIPAIVRQGSIYGMQFHPEKSGDTGERLLEAYRDMVEKRRL